MKQYRITSADILAASDDDCLLSPDDPIHALKSASMLGGLGSQEALANYMSKSSYQLDNSGTLKAQTMREQNIKPGTDEWFKLWFSRK